MILWYYSYDDLFIWNKTGPRLSRFGLLSNNATICLFTRNFQTRFLENTWFWIDCYKVRWHVHCHHLIVTSSGNWWVKLAITDRVYTRFPYCVATCMDVQIRTTWEIPHLQETHFTFLRRNCDISLGVSLPPPKMSVQTVKKRDRERLGGCFASIWTETQVGLPHHQVPVWHVHPLWM